MVYYKVRTGERVRFETLNLDEARNYAQRIYDREGIIPEIEEFDK